MKKKLCFLLCAILLLSSGCKAEKTWQTIEDMQTLDEAVDFIFEKSNAGRGTLADCMQGI